MLVMGYNFLKLGNQRLEIFSFLILLSNQENENTTNIWECYALPIMWDIFDIHDVSETGPLDLCLLVELTLSDWPIWVESLCCHKPDAGGGSSIRNVICIKYTQTMGSVKSGVRIMTHYKHLWKYLTLWSLWHSVIRIRYKAKQILFTVSEQAGLVVTFWTHIPEMLGSNLLRDTDNRDRGFFLWFSSAHSDKLWDSAWIRPGSPS
jgi:hypothetical protein